MVLNQIREDARRERVFAPVLEKLRKKEGVLLSELKAISLKLNELSTKIKLYQMKIVEGDAVQIYSNKDKFELVSLVPDAWGERDAKLRLKNLETEVEIIVPFPRTIKRIREEA